MLDYVDAYKSLLQADYCAYCEYVNDGWIPSKFHRFLCDKVQEFIERPVEKHVAYRVLVISTPPQHGKSMTITETQIGRAHV